MAKRRKALFVAMILSIASLASVVVTRQFAMQLTGLSGAEHGPGCHYNHYESVDPTEISHGSREFWACCTHLSYVLEEPQEGEITEKGAFTGEAFDSLSPSDDRYVAPLSAQTHYLRIDDGEPIPLVDFTSTLTSADSCVLRFGVDGLELDRGQIITFYRGEDKLAGIGEEIGSNLGLRSHIDDLDKTDFFVQTPSDSVNVHLNIYADGSMRVWASEYQQAYFQILVLRRDGINRWIDFNLRLDQPFVQIYDDIAVPKGYLSMHLYEEDQIRFVRYRWWDTWTSTGDGWINLTTEGAAEACLQVVRFEGDYFLGCEGITGYAGTYKDRFLFASYAKDFFINDVAVPRELLRFDYDQVQVEVDLKKGDRIYFKRYNVNGEKIIGAGCYDLGLADLYLVSGSGDALEVKKDGTYYFASWTTMIYFELRNTSWVKVVNGFSKGGLALFPDNHRYCLDAFELKAGDRLYFHNDDGEIVNAGNLNESLRWNAGHEHNYVHDIFFIDVETGEFIAKRDCRVMVSFNIYDPTEKFFLAIMDRVWKLEVDGTVVAQAATQDLSTTFAFENVALEAGQKVRIYDDYSTCLFGYGDLSIDLDGGYLHFGGLGDGRMLVKDTGVYSFSIDCSPNAVQFKNVHVREENDPPLDSLLSTSTRLPGKFASYWDDRVFLVELFDADLNRIGFVTGYERVITGDGSPFSYHVTSDTSKVRIYCCAKGTIVPDLDAESGPGYVYAYLTDPMYPDWGYETKQPYYWTVRSW